MAKSAKFKPNKPKAETAPAKARPSPVVKAELSAPSSSSARAGSKSAAVIDLLKSKHGASIPEMMEATGWQAHSVRGFLAGSLRKRHGIAVESAKAEGEPRRYRAR